MLQNPIEPSSDFIKFDRVPDYQIDDNIPTHWSSIKSKPVFQDAYSVPILNHRPIKPFYMMPVFDPDIGSLQQQDHEVPHRLSTEDNNKIFLPPSNIYPQQSNGELEPANELLSDVFYGVGIPSTSQTVVAKSAPEVINNPLTVIILALSPQEVHAVQESIVDISAPVQQEKQPVTTTPKNVEDEGSTTVSPTGLSPELLNEWILLTMLKKEKENVGVQDESDDKIHKVSIPTGILSVENNSTAEDETNSWMTTETPEEKSNSIFAKENSNALPIKEESNVVITEEITTEDVSDSPTTIEPKPTRKIYQLLKTKQVSSEELEELRQMNILSNFFPEFPSDSEISGIPVVDHTPQSPSVEDDTDDY